MRLVKSFIGSIIEFVSSTASNVLTTLGQRILPLAVNAKEMKSPDFTAVEDELETDHEDEEDDSSSESLLLESPNPHHDFKGYLLG